MPALFAREMKSGDVVHVIFAGGGGLGPPTERDPSLVLEDVQNGIVSLDAAREVYRVEIDPSTMMIDFEATARARSSPAREHAAL
jgi:N-methylhydantoinase B